MGKFRKFLTSYMPVAGWLGGAKVAHILHHRGVQLILAYSCQGLLTL